jgi:hypothetical protein
MLDMQLIKLFKKNFEVWPCWRRCGLVGGGVALLEEVWPVGGEMSLQMEFEV